ncbi:MAG: CHAD domain-containing protein [Ignavibacteriae bacterium]|nr:CHAD domain-containing protein [Ignavibacteriota bacterium]
MKTEEEITLFLIGSKFFKTNLNRLAAQAEGVRNSAEIEYLHRMRVASRRLLNGLSTFSEAIPKRKLNKWNLEIRSLVRVLGKSRDLDVQIKYLRSNRKNIKTKNYKIGIERLILRLEQRRNQKQPGVVEAIYEFNESSFKRDIKNIFDARNYKKRLTIKKLHDKKFINKIKKIISSKITGVLVFDETIYDQQNTAELHELRKAIKQLRYTLETFDFHYGGCIKMHIKIIKNIQDILGRIHDYDMWVELIPKFIIKEKRRTEKYFGNIKNFGNIERGLLHFLKEVNNKRKKEYKQFILYWDELKSKKYWESIPVDLNSLIK